MASAIADLETGLQAMSTLKPPGVSGTRIQSLLHLCIANVQSESIIIQKIYLHFKKTDSDHKLGVLYVIDSVTRKWLELAKSHGQPVDGSAKDGTYAAGVHRVTELLPSLMTDIIQTAPDNQKEKIVKLLDIWDKAQCFPQHLIDSFKAKVAAAQVKSDTPDGSPAPEVLASLGLRNNKGSASNTPAATVPNNPPPPAAPPNSVSIMEALANIARHTGQGPPPSQPPAAPQVTPSTSAPAPPTAPAQPVAPFNGNIAGLLSSLSHKQGAAPPAAAQPPPISYQMPQQQPAQHQRQQGMPAYPPAPPAGYPSSAPAPAPANNFGPDMQQQLVLIKALADQGIPYDKIPGIIQTLQAGNQQPPSGPAAPPPGQQPYGGGQGWNGPNGQDACDSLGGYDDRHKGRSRSRSPGRRWDSRGSPRGSRDDYGGRRYEDRGRGGGRGSDYRQRSPAGRRRSGSPSQPPAHPGHEKWVEYDKSIPNGSIRVFSRTLFVGGVTCTESELRQLFNAHGDVQTCIVNRDKRHAFVKMVTRRDAVAAKEAMDHPENTGGLQLRTRWGVGYGPRNCSDYNTGISVIPISALTEADCKWMLNAELGGSGGRPIESGLVVEEPDIEIGAGVSSKAISRRMQTDKSGNHGPRSSRTGEERWRGNGNNSNQQGNRGNGRRDDYREQASGANAQPLPQQFPFGIGTMANGMPNWPPGFSFPAPEGQ